MTDFLTSDKLSGIVQASYIVAAVRCAPPQNKPTPAERDTCAPWIHREVELLLPHVRAVVALGSYGWDAALRALRGAGLSQPLTVPCTAQRSGNAVALATAARPRHPIRKSPAHRSSAEFS